MSCMPAKRCFITIYTYRQMEKKLELQEGERGNDVRGDSLIRIGVAILIHEPASIQRSVHHALY